MMKKTKYRRIGWMVEVRPPGGGNNWKVCGEGHDFWGFPSEKEAIDNYDRVRATTGHPYRKLYGALLARVVPVCVGADND